MKRILTTLLIIIPVLIQAQPKANDTIITSLGDTITFSREQQRAIKLGDSVRYVTIAKPRPMQLNGVVIIDPDSLYKGMDDSTVFAMYNSTPVRYDKRIDTNIFHVVIYNHKEISFAVDSCFKFFDKRLQPGVYSVELYNVVIDTNGKLVYYETEGIKGHAESRSAYLASMKGHQHIPAAFAQLFNHLLDVLLHQQQYVPLMLHKQKTPYYFGKFGTSLSKGEKKS